MCVPWPTLDIPSSDEPKLVQLPESGHQGAEKCSDTTAADVVSRHQDPRLWLEFDR